MKIVMRYRGIGDSRFGPGVPVEFVLVIYGFEHGGVFYIFQYATTSDWIAREKSAFARSIASVRFPNVA